MREYAAYIRVSTVRQGERGVSLVEQRAIIEAYAARERLTITKWYEERETAARVGRTLFRTMLRDLRHGDLHGLILHKIDRGARNLSDWAALSELADSGIDVRIAGDTLDLGSRGGRLSADIQAVVAADYIRNLKEEVKKGQRGRLKQGFYPWAAPLGYRDTGAAKAKEIDPKTGPIVRRAFEAYATGEYSIRTLRKALATWGLTTPSGRPLSRNVVNAMLHRSFYYGLIEVGGTCYPGVHEPLISKELFDRVGAVLQGRVAKRSYEQRPYAFRRMIRCARCSRHLYAELQKGHTYYRCHTDGCQGTSHRESALVERVLAGLGEFPVTEAVIERYNELVAAKLEELMQQVASQSAGAQMRAGQLDERLNRLTDAYIDGGIDRNAFETRKAALERERADLALAVNNPERAIQQFRDRAEQCLELLETLKTLDEIASPEETRALVKSAVSNCTARAKYVDIAWTSEVTVLLAKEPDLVGPPTRDSYRTAESSDPLKRLVERLHAEVLRASSETQR